MRGYTVQEVKSMTKKELTEIIMIFTIELNAKYEKLYNIKNKWSIEDNVRAWEYGFKFHMRRLKKELLHEAIVDLRLSKSLYNQWGNKISDNTSEYDLLHYDY